MERKHEVTNGLFNRRTVYNEIDPYASKWLRRLCSAGHITPGEVIEEDIAKLTGSEIRGAHRFHAFAGIGVWDYALQLAGWPTDVPVWTGSCPCQPFSIAGRKRGTKDERHLWPEWFRLIDECRPPVVFGEQVASPLGRAWFDTVSTNLERLGYACGAADLCAAGVGAPHIRQRLFFVAVSSALADSRRTRNECTRHEMGSSSSKVQGEIRKQRVRPNSGDGGTVGHIHDAEINRRKKKRQLAKAGYATNGFWRNAEWIPCRDEVVRALEPGTCPVAHGSPEGMGKLRAYGNAIVPQIAAVFIEAALRSIHHELF